MALIDPSRTTPRDWLIVGIVVVVAMWLWHEFVLTPSRLIGQLCERADALEIDKTSEEARNTLDEMIQICRERQPIVEGP